MVAGDDLLNRITARPDLFGGKPIIRDMRVSVELILSLLAQGVSQEELLDDYPDLESNDIRACVAYARLLGWRLGGDYQKQDLQDGRIIGIRTSLI